MEGRGVLRFTVLSRFGAELRWLVSLHFSAIRDVGSEAPEMAAQGLIIEFVVWEHGDPANVSPEEWLDGEGPDVS